MPATPQLLSIQFLRAVAAIGVVVHHALDISFRTGWGLGAIGVDIFFVISGFVMYVSTNDDTRASRFLVRRLWRIYPMYWIATAAYLAVMGGMYGYFFGWEHIVRSLALFPPRAPSAYPVLFPAWTLTFEMVFYTGLAAALAVTRTRDGAAFVAGALMVSLALLEYSKQPFGFMQYLFKARLCEFALGLLCAWFWSRGHLLKRSHALVMLAVACVYLLFHPNDNVAGTPLLVWGVPSAAIVFAFVSLEASGIGFGGPVNKVLGESSYAIYLFHPVVLAVLWKLIAPAGTAMATIRIPEMWFFLLLVGGAVAIGCLAWWLLDRPIQQLRRRGSKPISLAGTTP